MIHGGNATVYVADINVSIRFYTETLGLKLRMRAGDNWAEIDAGPGLVIGLHPTEGPHMPKPGTRGSVAIRISLSSRDSTHTTSASGSSRIQVNIRGFVRHEGPPPYEGCS